MTVSLPTTISIGEGEGIVEVCVTLSAMEDTERNFDIALATKDDTGIEQGIININFRTNIFCSNKCFRLHVSFFC